MEGQSEQKPMTYSACACFLSYRESWHPNKTVSHDISLVNHNVSQTVYHRQQVTSPATFSMDLERLGEATMSTLPE
jgi:hypothetical protein